MSAAADKSCKFCYKNPRYTNGNGQVTSLYCSNVCAKRAGAPLPNPGGLVKRSKKSDLPQLLAQEAQLEKAKDDPVEPESIISLVQGGLWEIESQEGTTDVSLTRKYKNEKIRVNFNIAELDSFEPDEESDDEESDNEESDNEKSDNGESDNERDAKNQNGLASQGNEEESDDEIAPEPIECRISIAKPRGGALLIDSYAWTNKLSISTISYIKDARLVDENSAEADKKILASGVGPEFESLPKRIKEEFKKYLDDRGIDGTLAQAINEFINYKTQKEALGWFEAVGAFVAA